MALFDHSGDKAWRFTSWPSVHELEASCCRGSRSCPSLKQAKGDRAFAELLLVARETGLEALDLAYQLAHKQGHLNTSIVLNELRRLTSPARVSMMATPDALVLLLCQQAWNIDPLSAWNVDPVFLS